MSGALNLLAEPFQPITKTGADLSIDSTNSFNMPGPLNPHAKASKPSALNPLAPTFQLIAKPGADLSTSTPNRPGLMDLPTELFEQVIDDIVEIMDVPELLRLRAVCTTLAVAVDHVLLAKVPMWSYKQFYYSGGPDVHLAKNLGEIIFQRLHHTDELPHFLSSYIISTVEEVLKVVPSDPVDQTDQMEFEKRLCYAIASYWQNGGYWPEFLGLEAEDMNVAYTSWSWETEDDCLVTAAAADNLPAIHHFLAKGGKVLRFGYAETLCNPIIAAAASASTETVALLLEQIRPQVEKFAGDLDFSPLEVLYNATEAAACAHAYDTAVLLIDFQKEYLLTEDQ